MHTIHWLVHTEKKDKITSFKNQVWIFFSKNKTKTKIWWFDFDLSNCKEHAHKLKKSLELEFLSEFEVIFLENLSNFNIPHVKWEKIFKKCQDNLFNQNFVLSLSNWANDFDVCWKIILLQKKAWSYG